MRKDEGMKYHVEAGGQPQADLEVWLLWCEWLHGSELLAVYGAEDRAARGIEEYVGTKPDGAGHPLVPDQLSIEKRWLR